MDSNVCFTAAQPACTAEPDDAAVRVLDAAGKVVGEGVAQLRTLPAGHYLLEARVPPDAATTHPGDLWILGNHRLLCADVELDLLH